MDISLLVFCVYTLSLNLYVHAFEYRRIINIYIGFMLNIETILIALIIQLKNEKKKLYID